MPDWVTSLPAVLTALLTLTHVVVCVLALGVFPGSRKPSTAMAWLILVLAVPYFGFLVFLLFGRTSVGRKRREWQLDVNRQVVAALEQEAPDRPAVNVPDDVRGLAHLNQNLGALPLTSDNTVEITTDYPGCFEAMRREVDAAEKFVHVQFYISAWDEMTAPFFESMAAAAERGVDVRFLFDHLGSRGIPGYKDIIAKLEATKIVWAPMLPVRPLKGDFRRPDLRNHRKILVVDGRVGVRGLAEPDRARLQQAEEPQARPRVGRADDPGRGPGRAPAQPRLRHRLVQRDQREPAVDPRARHRPLPPRRASPSAGSAPRWCRADRASRPRTTSASSTACCTPPSAGCR